MMIAAAPVLDGSGTGKHLGLVIMGQLMTPETCGLWLRVPKPHSPWSRSPGRSWR